MSANLCPFCRRTGHDPVTCPDAPHRKSRAVQEEAVRSLDVQGFWKLAGRLARRLGFVRQAVAMYYCMADPATPLHVKAAVAGALAYFVLPLDLVPDLLPIVGFGDDASVVLGTWALVRGHVTDEHLARADRKLGLAPARQRA